MIIYYHVFCVDHPQCFEIVKDQLDMLSGVKTITEINCCVTGNSPKMMETVLTYLKTVPLVKIRKAVVNDKTYERFTLLELRKDAEKRKKEIFGYLHNKGISYVYSDPEEQWYQSGKPMKIKELYDNVWAWRKFMEYYCFQTIDLSKFEVYDTYGVMLRDAPTLHYSGNFWVAKGEYLAKLPFKIGPDYLDPERWLLSISCKPYSAKQSDANQYRKAVKIE